jgi:hypothetical protein
MKRKLFVGSSKEGLAFADKVTEQITRECGDWITSETWSDGGVFTLNNSALDSLLKASRKFDYGILVASKDDILHSRGKDHFVPRDNVMFEMGMFLGSLGLTRAFLLVEEESKLPTDYNGVTVSYFQRGKAGSLEKAIGDIVRSIQGTRTTFNLKPVPSAALAIGYFTNFVQPLAKKRQEANIPFKLEILLPTRLKDIRSEILAHRNANPSNEVSVYGDNQRPIVHELQTIPHHYWDVPTTLSTLGMMMDILIPSNEVGINQEKQDWIEHELRNFAGTIEMMVKDCAACHGRISVLTMAK